MCKQYIVHWINVWNNLDNIQWINFYQFRQMRKCGSTSVLFKSNWNLFRESLIFLSVLYLSFDRIVIATVVPARRSFFEDKIASVVIDVVVQTLVKIAFPFFVTEARLLHQRKTFQLDYKVFWTGVISTATAKRRNYQITSVYKQMKEKKITRSLNSIFFCPH